MSRVNEGLWTRVSAVPSVGGIRGTIVMVLEGPCRDKRLRGRMGIDNESDQVREGHLVDALALRGDEGRGTLR